MEMIVQALREQRKKVRYAASFLRRKLVHVNLQLLYDCTFRCDICDFWKEPYRQHPRLSLEQVELISDKLAQIGPQIVSIGGGEPLLHPDIVGVVRALARHHFPVMICNGWFMTPQRARELFAAGIHEVSISVDYADARRHDRQRGVEGAYQRAMEALRMLAQNRVHPWQRVHMISVIMDDNLDQVEPLIQRCRAMGITYLCTLYSDFRGTKDPRQVPADVSHRLLELKRHYPEFVVLRGYVERFSEAVRCGGVGPCQAGRSLCNIDSQGNVGFCIDRVDEPLANILTDDISAVERALLRAHRVNACKDCWTSCRGSIETLEPGKMTAANLWDYFQMTRSVDLDQARG